MAGSTKRLVKEAEDRGAEVEIVDPLEHQPCPW